MRPRRRSLSVHSRAMRVETLIAVARARRRAAKREERITRIDLRAGKRQNPRPWKPINERNMSDPRATEKGKGRGGRGSRRNRERERAAERRREESTDRLLNIIFSARENFSLFRSSTVAVLLSHESKREKGRKGGPLRFRFYVLTVAEPDAPHRCSSCRLSNSTRDLA